MKSAYRNAVAILLGLALSVEAGAVGPKRIGFVSVGTRAQADRYLQAFQDGLRELGYVEGRNVTIDFRSARGRPELVPEAYRELAASGVDVLVAGTNIYIAGALSATSTIPIVMAVGVDPVGAGFVRSLSRPGRNVTGITFDAAPEIAGKNFEVLKLAVPSASRVALLWNPGVPGIAAYRDAGLGAAESLKLEVREFRAGTPAELDVALSTIADANVEGLVVLGDPLFFANRQKIVAFAARMRLPAVYPDRSFVDAGGLLSHGPDVTRMFKRSAGYVDKILRGARAEELPIAQPTEFELVASVKAAKAQGLTIPPLLLLRAAHIVE